MTQPGESNWQKVRDTAGAAVFVALVVALARDPRPRPDPEAAFWTGFGRAYFGLPPKERK
jgi:hypothetical protein